MLETRKAKEGVSVEVTRDEVMKMIADSSIYGNLGFLIGSGFSKAVLSNDFNDNALSWGELIEKAAKELGVDYASICKEGRSYPEIATLVCVQLQEQRSITYKEARTEFKNVVCRLTNWLPNKDQRETFSHYFRELNPSWIVTTNYDLVLESILTGKSISLGPDDTLVTPKNMIPIYHLHGIRLKPESLIITQEDYVKMLRPNAYRQLKLSLAIKESMTVILGYSLGDINVLTALDWSSNIFEERASYCPNDLIQIVRREYPKSEPYRDRHGILVLEVKEMKDFLDEVSNVVKRVRAQNESKLNELNQLIENLTDPDKRMIDQFIDEPDFRRKLLSEISEYEYYLIESFIVFLSKCIDKTWERSEPRGAFEGYNQNLNIIIDIITNLDFDKIPPALFEFIAYSFERVGRYIGRDLGQSWNAAETWNTRKGEIPSKTAKELYHFAKQQGYIYVKRIMGEIYQEQG